MCDPTEPAGEPTPTLELDLGAAAGARRPEAIEPALRRGSTVGRYVVLELVGAGGMGRVYAAYDPDLDRKVALKVLRPKGRSAVARRNLETRLLREAKTLARLAHPNVVAVFDAGTVDDRVFVAMEYVAGRDLVGWLAASERSTEEIVRVFAAAGRGLAAAHDAGVVHRDFKPGNVLVGDDGRVRVCDFGIALSPTTETVLPSDALADVDTARLRGLVAGAALTGTGVAAGTPRYMAPEQQAGHAVTPAADQYSFGVALRDALLGDPERSGSDTTAAADRARFGPLIERAMQPDPDRRFASMEALLAALEPPPARRARRTVLAAAAVVAAAAVAWALRPPVVDPCSGGSARMAEVWDGTARRQLAAMWKDRGGGLGGAIFEGIDQYRDAWVEQYAETCRANRRGEESDDLLDRRMGCLDERRQELRSLLVELADGASSSVASRAVAELTPLDRCRDRAALTAPLAPPDAPTRAAVAAARGELAVVRAKRLAGHYEEAAERADRAVEAARDLGYWPLIAESWFERARCAEHDSDSRTAVDAYGKALLAAEAGRHDRVAVEVFLRLVRLAGYEQVELEQAEDYASMAAALLASLGERRRLEATLENHLGLLRYQQGEYEVALSHHQRALRIALAGGDVESSRSDRLLDAVTHLRLGTAARALGRLDDADAAYGRALESYRSVYGDVHPEVAMVLDRRGGVALEQGHDERAEQLRRRSWEILVEAFGEDDSRALDALNNLGTVVLQRGQFEVALRLFERLETRYRASDGSPAKLAAVSSNLGSAYLGLDRRDEALAAFETALRLQESTYGDGHPAAAMARYNLAEALNQIERFEPALAHHRRALADWRQRLGSEHYLIAHGSTGEGRALLGLGRAAEAVVALRLALDLWSTLDRDPFYIAETRWLLARALTRAGDPATGFEQARRAREIFAADSGREALVAEIDAWLASAS